MSTNITATLNALSLEVLESRLKAYADDLERKANSLLTNMLQEGETYAINSLGHIDTGETLASILGYREGDYGIIKAGGSAIWIEFGTGVTFNSEMHPKAAELGMSAHGTYVSPPPFNKSQTPHGGDPDGWYYINERGERVHTYGIPQNRFMYNTAQMLRKEYKRIAQEVFK